MGLSAAMYLGRKARNTISPDLPDSSDAVAPTFPLPDMPSFSTWYIPRKISLYLFPLAVGYLMTMFTRGIFQLAGQMMYAVFATVYMIQGLSTASWWLKRMFSSSAIRLVILIIIFFLGQGVLVWIGLFDQFMDIRRLRSPMNTSSFLNNM